jgi:hypothetical protein
MLKVKQQNEKNKMHKDNKCKPQIEAETKQNKTKKAKKKLKSNANEK